MQRFTAVLALLASTSVLAAPDLDDKAIATATQLREQALTGSSAYDIVESLTTEVGPRLAGSPAFTSTPALVGSR